jgi:hypothetical protein
MRQNPAALPVEYFGCYRAALTTCGKLTLSEENAFALIRMAQQSITYRRTLEQIGKNGTSNADLALQARNALRDEVPCPTPRKRLVGIDTVKPRRRVLAPA